MDPMPQLTRLPATALVTSPVVATLMAPERKCVTTNQAMRPQKKPIQGARRTAMVEVRDQRRMRPTGIEAPPTMMPRTVRSQVRLMDAALRMQQKLWCTDISILGTAWFGLGFKDYGMEATHAARTKAYSTMPP